MKPLRFSDKALIELVRRQAARHGGADSWMPAGWQPEPESGFDAALRTWARRYAAEHDFAVHNRRAEAVLQGAGSIVLLFALGCGFLATAWAFPADGQRVNFFWCLAVLLGLNLLLLTLWVLTALLQPKLGGHTRPQHWLGYLAERAGRRIAGLQSAQAGFLQDWLIARTPGRIGFWRFSKVVHLAWAAYLTGGLCMILLMLSARQYTFGWETTLLSSETFQTLTALLGWLPERLGFAVPDAEIVRASEGALSNSFPDAQRRWAGLLLGCLLCYGILPRLLLAGLVHFLQRRAEQQMRLDTSLPDYVRLRQRLHPAVLKIGVVDADDEPRPQPPSMPAETRHLAKTPPQQACWFALEPDDRQPWPPSAVGHEQDLGVVDDGSSRQTLLQKLEELPRTVRDLVAVADLVRTPDRGAQRFLQRIAGHRYQIWIGLRAAPGQKIDAADRIARLSGWYQLAAQSGIPEDQVFELVEPTLYSPAKASSDEGSQA